MLACVYPAESFKTKAVAVKPKEQQQQQLQQHQHSGRSKRRTKLLVPKERPGIAKQEVGTTLISNELPVGGGGAVLVLSELESMAARQQREIAQQRRLLEQREARLAVLRGAQEPAQQERLARLRHRLDQQQSKLNRLRLLRSQTDQSRANNATLTSDLDCIRALFNEKEKELSLAVAKVDELTRQLEELRGRHNGNSGGGQVPSPASVELEKLRRELMYRNKMNEQQNQVVSQQRLVLAQRQAEMASIDARIAQLQGRLQRKRALNQRLLSQQLNNRQSTNPPGYEHSAKQQQQQHQQHQEFINAPKLRPAGNVAAIEPYSHIPNDSDFNLNKNDPKYQTLPYNTKFTVNLKTIEDDVNKNKIQHSQSASQIGQRATMQQLGHQIAHSQSQSHIQGQSQLLGPGSQSPQQQQQQPSTAQQHSPQGYPQNYTNNNNIINNNNNNNNNQNGQQLFTTTNYMDHRHQQNSSNIQQKQITNTQQDNRQSMTQAHNHRNLQANHHQKPVSSVAPSFPVKSPIYQTSSIKINPVMPQTLSLIGRGHTAPTHTYTNPTNSCPQGNNNDNNYRFNQGQYNQVSYKNSNYPGQNSYNYGQNIDKTNDNKIDRFDMKEQQINNQIKYEQHQSVHQFNKHEQIDNGNRITSKYDANQPFKHEANLKGENKVDNLGKYGDAGGKHDHQAKLEGNKEKAEGGGKGEDKMKPALPPKPVKPNPPPRLNSQEKEGEGETKSIRGEKEEEVPPIPTSEPPESPNEPPLTSNHQIIKARPLSLKKGHLTEQPRLRYAKSNVHVSINRRIEMPPAFLFPETEIPADLMQTDQQQQQQQQNNTTDVTDCISLKQKIHNEDPISNDKLEDSDIVEALNVINIEDKLKKDEQQTEVKTDVIRRKKGNLKSTTGKVNLSRRVSFDPLALLLDASLEGELELVKKTAKEVANPSSANDEGITALHNAICAGHLDIVKFLVEFGCDVNAQDSDGWTPLHCAASCNNLAMVRFLVEHGACIFATTLSDHETAAEKCEEDEEGFDGCSEYLYSVQEKLGIMNNGQVFAVFEYDAQHNDELSLKNGDQVVVLRKGDDNEREWWWSKLGHREGYVPRNLLGLYPRVQPSKSD